MAMEKKSGESGVELQRNEDSALLWKELLTTGEEEQKKDR